MASLSLREDGARRLQSTIDNLNISGHQDNKNRQLRKQSSVKEKNSLFVIVSDRNGITYRHKRLKFSSAIMSLLLRNYSVAFGVSPKIRRRNFRQLYNKDDGGCGSVFIWYGYGSSILGWKPIRIQVFHDKKWRKNLHKGGPSYKKSLQTLEGNIQHFKTTKFLIFFYFFLVICALLDPVPLTRLNLDTIRIRIRNPADDRKIATCPMKRWGKRWTALMMPSSQAVIRTLSVAATILLTASGCPGYWSLE